MRRRSCPKCGEKRFVKAGFHHNKQRFKCKHCSATFVGNITQSYPEKTRQQALAMYLEGLGFRAIERLTGVSHVTVMLWVRQAGKTIAAPRFSKKVEAIELDELCTHIQKKTESVGCGWLLTAQPAALLPPSMVAVAWPRHESSLKSCP